ncbi:GyrI-like domain-containing protein [Christiangramia salexigens]|uniref:GyrI-like small molecule binding domain-containing protein n=1 Tax=Christiangramia salexigens TaxID=1913577 RepID=A0A1L3J3S6_9FLAO|nr:GyrI-like domain-containing protein [Christiangramia salexigens]APG59752.1 hypothetical protein LPB144_04685 [Christiangramia salexigens]
MKKILWVSLLILSAGVIWFLFIKEYDYQFHMTAKYGPGVAYDEIADWKKFDGPNSKDNISITEENPFKGLKQEISAGTEAVLEFNWEFEKANDSVTDLTLKVRSRKNQIKNRLAILSPFQTSELVDSLENKLIRFKKRLNTVQETYAVKILDSLVTSPELDCICRSSKNVPVDKKAGEMVRTITSLEDYITTNNLELNGVPFVKVERWDMDTKKIDFDFCFPVKLEGVEKIDSDYLEFRKIPSFKAIKAIFNGNYRMSHLAWYDLMHEIELRELESTGLPLEVFYDNPNMGTPSINWKAEIFIPVTE